jgi:hypothetical protein
LKLGAVIAAGLAVACALGFAVLAGIGHFGLGLALRDLTLLDTLVLILQGLLLLAVVVLAAIQTATKTGGWPALTVIAWTCLILGALASLNDGLVTLRLVQRLARHGPDLAVLAPWLVASSILLTVGFAALAVALASNGRARTRAAPALA